MFGADTYAHPVQQKLLLPCVCAATITALALGLTIPLLSRLRQRIRANGPATHHVKAGTPTAAGVVFIPIVCAVALAWHTSQSTVLMAAIVSVTMLAGLLDDVLSTRPTSGRRGLSVAHKLAIQVVLGAATGVAALMQQQGQAHAAALLPQLALPLPAAAYAALCAFTHVSEVNAVNLTDGLDGLCASCCALVLAAAALLCGPLDAGVATFCAAAAGACCGFLLWNRHPAAAFMGDAGAQALGATIACAAALSGHFGAVAVLSLVFVAEALSVIVQVGHVRWTRARTGSGRRLLRMAPLHHHFEELGVPEVVISASATLFQSCVVIAVLLYWVAN